jgi:hypothetical protein
LIASTESRWRLVVGWAALLIGVIIASMWSFWGTIEAFHEGWWRPTLPARLLWLLAYIGPGSVLTLLNVLSVRFRVVGGIVYVLIGLILAAFFATTSIHYTIIISLTAVPVLIGCGHLFARIRVTKRALVVAASPILVSLVCAVEPVIRVSGRNTASQPEALAIAENGLDLVWAQRGPGWNVDGHISWSEAVEVARHLNAAGTTVEEEPQDVWRLPTIDEAVRSMSRNGKNAGGVWNPKTRIARYETTPDKEAPMWEVWSPVIYWWTSEEDGPNRAFVVVYHGGIHSKPQVTGSPSFGFRLVRDSGSR